jgi:hypothetical protein
MALVISNPEAFAKHIETQVTDGHMSYLDAIVHFCEARELDIESVVPFITDKMKAALAREGLALHMLNPRKMDAALF